MKSTNFSKTFVVFLLLSFSVLCVNALEFTYTYSGTTLKYNQIGTTNTVEVSDNGDKTLSTVVIPGTVSYDGTTYTVYRVADSGFKNNTNLTGVRYNAASLKAIGMSAFDGCSSLCQFTYGTGTVCNLPSMFTELGYFCFRGCAFERVVANFENVVYDNTVANNGAFFYKCTSLKTLVVTGPIPYSCFNGCTALTSVQLCETTVSESLVGDYSFYNCTALESVKFVDGSAWAIGSSAFSNCKKLTNITFGEGIEVIRALAFYNTGVTSVNLPSSQRVLVSDAFKGCSKLSSVTINSTINAADKKHTLAAVFNNCDNLCRLNFGEGVTEVVEGCAQNMTSLSWVEFPANGIEKIGARAFKDCSNLVYVSSIACNEIGEEAFYGCDIDSLDVDCMYIGEDAFSENRSMRVAILRRLEPTMEVCFVGSGDFYGSEIRILPKDDGFFNSICADTPFYKSNFVSAKVDCCNKAFPGTIFLCCPYLKTISIANPLRFEYTYPLAKVCPSLREYILESGGSSTSSYQAIDGCVYSDDGITLYLAPEGKTKRISPPSTLRRIGAGANFPSLVYDLTWVNSSSNIVYFPYVTSLDEPYTVIVTSEGAAAYTETAPAEQLNAVRTKWFVISSSGVGNGDLNNDGEVTVSDVTKLVQLVLNKNK